MPQDSRFFDSHDYSESNQAEVQARFRKDGLIYEAGNRLPVSAPGGMLVRVGTGEMMIQGFWYKNDANLDLAIGNNISGFTRIDRLVLHLSRNGNYANIIVLVGTPSATPSAPNVTQIPGGDWEISLATITIPTATTSAITTGMLSVAIPVSQAFSAGAELPVGQITSAHIAPGSIGGVSLTASTITYDKIAPGAVRRLAYSWVANTDIANGAGIAPGVGLLLTPTFLFNINQVTSIVEVFVSCGVYVICSGEVGSFVMVDNATRYRLGGDYSSAAGTGVNPFAGAASAQYTGLAGNHQLSVGIFNNGAVANVYCRPGSQPDIEHMSVFVWENMLP